MLDDNEKKLTYVNAGHNPTILVRQNQIIRLSEGGIILGVMKTIMPYNSNSINLESGDKIILFTNGFSESMNPYKEEFSEEKLEKISVETYALSSLDRLNKIQSDLDYFAQDAPQSDDITFLIIKVK